METAWLSCFLPRTVELAAIWWLISSNSLLRCKTVLYLQYPQQERDSITAWREVSLWTGSDCLHVLLCVDIFLWYTFGAGPVSEIWKTPSIGKWDLLMLFFHKHTKNAVITEKQEQISVLQALCGDHPRILLDVASSHGGVLFKSLLWHEPHLSHAISGARRGHTH